MSIINFISDRAAKLSAVPMTEIGRTTDLSEIIDSLECVLIAAEIEDEYGISISCAERVENSTVQNLAELVATKIATTYPAAAA